MPKRNSSISWNERENQDSKRIIEGQISCRQAKMIFTIRPIVKGKYRYMGNMRILSPTGKSKTLTDGKGKRIRKEFYLTELTDPAIRAAAERAAWDLYNSAYPAIQAEYCRVPIDQMTIIDAIGRWERGWLNSQKLKATTYESVSSKLESLCYQLPLDKSMWDITMSDVEKLKVNKRIHDKESGNTVTKAVRAEKADLRGLNKFIAFCISKVGFSRSNPVDEYIKSMVAPKKSGKALAAAAKRKYSLTPEEESKLHREVMNNIHDGRYMSLTLINCCGVDIANVGKVMWEDIIFDDSDPDLVCIRQVRGRATATHNYLHPVCIDGARILRARYDYLHGKGYSTKKLNKKSVVCARKSPLKSFPQNEITDFIRSVLYRIDISASCLQDNRDGMVGGGPMLLKRNFDHRLDECGLVEQVGIKEYLKFQALKDITSDNYRSFIDPYAQQQIYCYLRRYNFLDEQVVTTPFDVEENKENGTTIISSPVSGTKQVPMICGKVRIQKGAKIIIEAETGIRGNLIARVTKPDGTTKRLIKPTRLEL